MKAFDKTVKHGIYRVKTVILFLGKMLLGSPPTSNSIEEDYIYNDVCGMYCTIHIDMRCSFQFKYLILREFKYKRNEICFDFNNLSEFSIQSLNDL